MSKLLRTLFGVLLVIIVAVLFFFANRYSYIDTIEISVLEDEKYITVDPYQYDLNKIRRYYMFTNTFINHDVKEEFACKYRVLINNSDELCYDGGKYALYTKNFESLDDVKEAISKKELKINKSKSSQKIIVMNKSFAKMLEEL